MSVAVTIFGATAGLAKTMDWRRFGIQKAANQGYSDAQFALGLLYENGVGVDRNLGEAKTLYHEAAGHGNVNAQAALVRLQEK